MRLLAPALKRSIVAGIALSAIAAMPALSSGVGGQSPAPAARPIVHLPEESAGLDAIARTLIAAFDQVDIVALGEAHDRKIDSELRLALIRSPDFVKKVQAIVIECGSTTAQPTLDAYIRGENVPRPRDEPSTVDVIKEQVLEKHDKALVIYGQAHFYLTGPPDYLASMGDADIAAKLDVEYPGRTLAVITVGALPRPSAIKTDAEPDFDKFDRAIKTRVRPVLLSLQRAPFRDLSASEFLGRTLITCRGAEGCRSVFKGSSLTLGQMADAVVYLSRANESARAATRSLKQVGDANSCGDSLCLRLRLLPWTARSRRHLHVVQRRSEANSEAQRRAEDYLPYGTLILAEGRSGHVIMFIVGLLAFVTPVMHMRGAHYPEIAASAARLRRRPHPRRQLWTIGGPTATVLRVAAIAAAMLVLQTTTTAAQGGEIVGKWRGTSTCVDTEHFPACRDEVVIYEARPRGGSADSVTVAADKVVNGVREPMGAFDFAKQVDGSWTADFQNARVHVRIVLQLTGDHLSGAMSDVPSGRRVREIELNRSR